MPNPISILAADIGGTHSRFAYFRQNFSEELICQENIVLKTKDFLSCEALLDHLKLEQFGLNYREYDLTVFAVPGFVQDKFCAPPNIAWRIDAHQIEQTYGLSQCHLINDFTAQAYACLTAIFKEVRLIQKGQKISDGIIGIIGAGTGLGHCALMTYGLTQAKVIPSEAGHTPFSFVGKHEHEYERFVMEKTQTAYCYGDQIVSGQGLSWLHEFLTGDPASPANIAAQFHPDMKTLQWFSRFYGRACRSYALSILPTKGLYITGGIAAKNPMLVEHPFFLEEFQHSPKQHQLLKSIPIALNTNELSGLFGAAYYGIMNTTSDGTRSCQKG